MPSINRFCVLLVIAGFAAGVARGAENPRSIRNFPSDWWPKYSAQSDDWFRGPEGRRIADNILTWQTPEGGWPLMNTTNEPWTGDPAAVGPWGRRGTFIGATTNELRFLAREYRATQVAKYRDAVLAGLAYIDAAQTATGGWPKSFPVLGENYHRHITFNDGGSVGVLNFLQEALASPSFDFLEAARKTGVRQTFDRGIACILKCQIVVDGRLTAWCQQHDEVTYEPRPARTFEPAAICAQESVGVVELLMCLPNPSPEIRKAVTGAMKWFESAKITGYEWVTIPDPTFALRKIDRVVRPKPGAVMWARYYEIGSNRPIFLGRDAVKHYTLAEIEQERRTGYAWYGDWPATLPAHYAQWRSKLSP
jgi:PelA/Pel-15E family pectate lyase